MKLDISLFKASEMVCIESALATFAKAESRNYEMMYLDALRFIFNYDKAVETGEVGPNLEGRLDREKTFRNIEKYHGIRIETGTKKDFRIVLKEKIYEQRKPIVFFIEGEYLEDYQKNHGNYFLVTGYEEDYCYCYNIHLSEEMTTLSFEVLRKAQEGGGLQYIIYDVVDEEAKSITLDDVIDEMNKSEYSDYIKTEENMLQFAECIRARLDLNKEAEADEDFYYVPIFLNMVDVMRGRMLFSGMFEYLYTLTGDKKADILSYHFSTIGRNWRKAWAKLQKILFMHLPVDNKRYKKSIDTVAEMIEEAAHYERYVLEKTLNRQFDFDDIGIRQLKAWGNCDKYTLEEIEISDIYNNRSFSRSSDNKEKADISGHKEYFVLSGAENIECNILGRKMILPIKYGHDDNVSCGGNTIDVDLENTKGMLFIGCAEWQDSVEEISIENEEQKLKLIFDVMDWYNYKGNIHCAWSGDIIDYEGDLDKRGIYSFLYEFPSEMNVKKIVLPNNPNVHIYKVFSVS